MFYYSKKNCRYAFQAKKRYSKFLFSTGFFYTPPYHAGIVFLLTPFHLSKESFPCKSSIRNKELREKSQQDLEFGYRFFIQFFYSFKKLMWKKNLSHFKITRVIKHKISFSWYDDKQLSSDCAYLKMKGTRSPLDFRSKVGLKQKWERMHFLVKVSHIEPLLNLSIFATKQIDVILIAAILVQLSHIFSKRKI